MTEPTKAQEKEFWERCGFKWWDTAEAWCFGKDEVSRELPPIDLNNLFKYAVPKLWKKLNRDGEAYKFDRIWKAIIRALLDGEDISDAVFWVIWEVINDRKE